MTPELLSSSPSLATATAPIVPRETGGYPRLDSFVILKEIGRGRQGAVFCAAQSSVPRLVALKVPHGEGPLPSWSLARVHNEVRAMGRLQHPNIVQIFDCVGDPGCPCLVLELVPGCSLAEYLAGQPVAPRWAACLLARVAEAMHHAHQRGVVHRDLKPAHILLTPGSSGSVIPKVLDWGVAKLLDAEEVLTDVGARLGTPLYMSPEQHKGEARGATPASDVYALGAILYELLTGSPPFPSSEGSPLSARVVGEPPLPPSTVQRGVPAALDEICLKCLEKAPERRYPSAWGLAAALRQAVR